MIDLTFDVDAMKDSARRHTREIESRTEDASKRESRALVADARARTPRKSGKSRAGWRGTVERVRRGRYVSVLTNKAAGAHYIERAARGELRKGRFHSAPDGIVGPSLEAAEERGAETLRRIAKG
jgi:hypothetical protein